MRSSMTWKWHGIIKICSILGGAGLLTISLYSFKIEYLKALQLDFSQFVSANKNVSPDVIEFDVASLKDGYVGADGLSVIRLQSTLEQILSHNPKRVILALSKNELTGTNEDLQKFIQFSRNYQNMYFYSRWGTDASLYSSPPFDSYPRHVLLKHTPDIKLGGMDSKVRRFLISMDGERYDVELEKLMSALDLKLPPLADFKGTFEIFDSLQVYLRLNRIGSVPHIGPNDDLRSVENKIVFVGTGDSHSTYMTIHPFGRFELVNDITREYYFPDMTYLAIMYSNLQTYSYIKSPTLAVNILVLFGALLLQISLLLKTSDNPVRFFVLSLFLLAAICSLNLVCFAFFSYFIDSMRIIIGTFVIQYLGMPYLFLKNMRKADQLRLEQEKLLNSQKIRSRFAIKAARASESLKTSAKLSHDIRNPLMAIQVVNGLLKGKVSAEITDLLSESTQRLNSIADGSLYSFRTKEAQDLGLSKMIENLLKTFKEIYPDVTFEFNAVDNVESMFPEKVLQRCLSNLITNAVEAQNSTNTPKRICLILESDDQAISIFVKDNGIGIPKEFKSKLFKIGSTFGKAGGTGLGLVQVRDDLKLFAGTIDLEESEVGTVFKVKIPKTVNQTAVPLSANVLIYEAGEKIYKNIVTSASEAEFNLARYSVISEAFASVEEISRFSKKWSFFLELQGDEDDEVVLDLLEKVSALPQNEGVIVVSSLGDIEELGDVQKLYRASFVDGTLLEKMTFYKRVSQ